MNQLDHQKAFDDARVVWERIDNLRELHDAKAQQKKYMRT